MSSKFRILLLTESILLCAAKCEKYNNVDSCKGKIIKDCICNFEYDPICGCDNATYGNACAGTNTFKKGACK